jgi:transcriptional regulator with XRE-family HTH domain
LDWAAAIKLLRRRLFLTQAQLAELVKVAPAAVCDWETGSDAPSPASQRVLRDLIARSELAAFDMASIVRQVRRSRSLVLLDEDSRFIEVSDSLCHAFRRDRCDVVDRTNSDHMLDEGFAAVEVCKTFKRDRGAISARIFNGGYDTGGGTIYTATDAMPIYSGVFGIAIVYIPFVITKAEFTSALFEHGRNYTLQHVDSIAH